jgi:hypothetical protein
MTEREAEATELVYTPGNSWAPALVALGFAGILTGIFVWFPYGVAGAIIAIVGAWMLVKAGNEDSERLPRSQTVTTAVLPATPPPAKTGE